ncbi:hypothetical protein LJR009_002601 [Bosea sp. LjRoot9]|uniref:hypothetical protein n=1 Tax=Bosea sp. LjRoot9 TaxID=3342341 RepID=UPI003ED0EF01
MRNSLLGGALGFWSKKDTPPPTLPGEWTSDLWDEFSRKNHVVQGFVGLDAMNTRCDMDDPGHPADIKVQFSGRLGADTQSALRQMRVSVGFEPTSESLRLASRLGEGAMGWGQTTNWETRSPPSLHLQLFGTAQQQRALEELFVRAKLLRLPHVAMNYWGTVVEPWWEPQATFVRVFSLSRVIFVQNLSLTGDAPESATPWP